MNDLFGEIRSWVQKPHWPLDEHQSIWRLIEHAYKTNPKQYKAQWIPYLQQAKHHWRAPFYHMSGRVNTKKMLAELRQRHELLPFAHFSLEMTGLEFDYPFDMRLFAASPQIERIRYLDLSHNDYHLHQIEAFAQSPHLRQVIALSLDGYDDCLILPGGSIKILANSPVLDTVEHLSLQDNRLNHKEVETLCASEKVLKLKTLNLYNNRFDDQGIKAIAQTPFTQLSALNLQNTDCGNEGAMALAKSTWLNGITHINLCGNPIGDDGLCALLDARTAEGLKTLNLLSTDLSNQSAYALANAPQLTSLRTLVLHYNKAITDEGYHALYTSPYLHESVRQQFSPENRISLLNAYSRSQPRSLYEQIVQDLTI